MHQSRTLYVGLDVHKESIAVAYVAPAPHAEVGSLGTSVHASARSINVSAGSTPKALILSLAMKRGRVAIGSPALSPTKAMSVGSWRPLGFPKSPGIGSNPPAGTPSNWPA
jgi:hypothetical protein